MTNCAFAASTLTITGSNYFPGATVALTGATGATDCGGLSSCGVIAGFASPSGPITCTLTGVTSATGAASL